MRNLLLFPSKKFTSRRRLPRTAPFLTTWQRRLLRAAPFLTTRQRWLLRAAPYSGRRRCLWIKLWRRYIRLLRGHQVSTLLLLPVLLVHWLILGLSVNNDRSPVWAYLLLETWLCHRHRLATLRLHHNGIPISIDHHRLATLIHHHYRLLYISTRCCEECILLLRRYRISLLHRHWLYRRFPRSPSSLFVRFDLLLQLSLFFFALLPLSVFFLLSLALAATTAAVSNDQEHKHDDHRECDGRRIWTATTAT